MLAPLPVNIFHEVPNFLPDYFIAYTSYLKKEMFSNSRNWKKVKSARS